MVFPGGMGLSVRKYSYLISDFSKDSATWARSVISITFKYWPPLYIFSRMRIASFFFPFGIILALMVLCSPIYPASPSKVQPKPANAAKVESASMDRAQLLDIYMSGELDSLLMVCENIRRKGAMMTRDDSIMVYKLLGVVYGANDYNRRKSESFFYQMLKLNPDENLLALAVGDSVESLFSNVRERYAALHPEYRSKADSLNGGSESSTSVPASVITPRAPDRGISPKVWYAVGATAALTGVTAFVLLNQEPEKNVNVIVQPIE